MDVTQQINRQMVVSGSGSSRPEYYSVNRSLNYAKGSNSLINAAADTITAAPAVREYKDAVGLYGAENIFIKVDLDISNTLLLDGNGILQDDYVDVVLSNINDGGFYWDDAVLDYSQDLSIVNTYEPAVLDNSLNFIPNAVASVNLQNLKTGNKYNDCWFDTRLYTKERMEHPYDLMYVPLGSYFYVGFHARDTKRLPYNVRMTVGEVIQNSDSLPGSERRYLVN